MPGVSENSMNHPSPDWQGTINNSFSFLARKRDCLQGRQYAKYCRPCSRQPCNLSDHQRQLKYRRVFHVEIYKLFIVDR